jgi:Domain of unknown function (DUF4864)
MLSHMKKSVLGILLSLATLQGGIVAEEFFQDNIPSVEKESNESGAQEILETIEAQLYAIRSNDIAKAYNLYTTANFKQATSLQEFKNLVQKFSVLAKNKTLSLTFIAFQEDVASVTGSISSTSDEVLTIEYDLQNENGNWKIMGIQLFK